MNPITSEELQGLTISNLKTFLNETNRKILETQEFLRVLNENKRVYELELDEKQKIQTTSLIKIRKYKYKGINYATTDIEIYLDNVDENGELIDNIAYRSLQYSDRTLLSSKLDALYKEYGFKKIITSMKLPKAISEKYNVEFDENMKR